MLALIRSLSLLILYTGVSSKYHERVGSGALVTQCKFLTISDGRGARKVGHDGVRSHDRSHGGKGQHPDISTVTMDPPTDSGAGRWRPGYGNYVGHSSHIMGDGNADRACIYNGLQRGTKLHPRQYLRASRTTQWLRERREPRPELQLFGIRHVA